MLIEWKADATPDERARVIASLTAARARYVEIFEAAGGSPSRLVVQSGAQDWMQTLAQLRAVARVQRLSTPYKLAARAVRPEGTVVRVGGVAIGGAEIVAVAGPCSVEDEAQIGEAARAVAGAGASLLRGGAYKPRTSPYAFQGLGARGLQLLAAAGRAAGLPTVTEVVRAEDVPVVAEHADMLQVGARNAQNFALLEAVGRAGKPVLLKRGPAMTVEDTLLSAEYVLAAGNPDVVLCERGIRTFERATRNTLDLSGVAALRRATHLPILVDPSHGTGRRPLVATMARAGIAAGADGVMIEVHPRPDESWSDAEQAMAPQAFAALCRDLAVDAAVLGRGMRAPCAATADDTLQACRGRIDAIDDALVRLLEARIRLLAPIAQAKRSLGGAIVSPEREAVVRARVAGAASDPGTREALLRVFEAIVHESRALQQPPSEGLRARPLRAPTSPVRARTGA